MKTIIALIIIVCCWGSVGYGDIIEGKCYCISLATDGQWLSQCVDDADNCACEKCPIEMEKAVESSEKLWQNLSLGPYWVFTQATINEQRLVYLQGQIDELKAEVKALRKIIEDHHAPLCPDCSNNYACNKGINADSVANTICLIAICKCGCQK